VSETPTSPNPEPQETVTPTNEPVETPAAETTPAPPPETPPADPPTIATETPTESPQMQSPADRLKNGYYWGTGRRKRAIARVRIRPGSGEFKVNGREIKEYFRLDKDRQTVVAPLETTDTLKRLDVFVNLRGGGTTGQADAVVLGLARALTQCYPEHTPKLREARFLSRDPRKVERKKYGQRGARRRFQFSKR